MKYLVLLSMFAMIGFAGCDAETDTEDAMEEVTPATDMETPVSDTMTSPTTM